MKSKALSLGLYRRYRSGRHSAHSRGQSDELGSRSLSRMSSAHPATSPATWQTYLSASISAFPVASILRAVLRRNAPQKGKVGRPNRLWRQKLLRQAMVNGAGPPGAGNVPPPRVSGPRASSTVSSGNVAPGPPGKRASLCHCPCMLLLNPVSQFRPLRRYFFERGPGRRARCLRRPFPGFEC